MDQPAAPAGRDKPMTCSVCGTGRDDESPDALAWSTSMERGAVRAVCPACTRSHVRSIEAKLPEEWW